MKPRLEPVPQTEEDRRIWQGLCCFAFHRPALRHGREVCAERAAQLSDRRDADRMLRIMTLGCRFCGSNSMHGEVHERDCIYATDPSARRVWLRKGARVIE